MRDGDTFLKNEKLISISSDSLREFSFGFLKTRDLHLRSPPDNQGQFWVMFAQGESWVVSASQLLFQPITAESKK